MAQAKIRTKKVYILDHSQYKGPETQKMTHEKMMDMLSKVRATKISFKKSHKVLQYYIQEGIIDSMMCRFLTTENSRSAGNC